MINIVKEKKKIIEATCDICGGDCMSPLFAGTEGDDDDSEIIKEFNGMVLNASWGYTSQKDCEIWDAVVCESCVDKHLNPIIKFLKKPLF